MSSSVGKLDVVYEQHKDKIWEKNGIYYRIVDRKLAKEIIINKHYSKKWNDGHFGYINIGIFKEKYGECLGVATYGHLNNPKSAFNFAEGIKSIDEVLELNRMWIDDILGMNTESQMISMSFRIIREVLPNVKIIQTFADGRLGVGTIYKASGFSYYGKTQTTFVRDTITGEIYHDVNLHNYARPNGVVSVWEPILNETYETFNVYTYRYLFFLHRKVKKYCLFKEEPFPSYNKGEMPFEFKWPTNISTMTKLVSCFEKKDRQDLVDLFLKKTFKKNY